MNVSYAVMAHIAWIQARIDVKTAPAVPIVMEMILWFQNLDIGVPVMTQKPSLNALFQLHVLEAS